MNHISQTKIAHRCERCDKPAASTSGRFCRRCQRRTNFGFSLDLLRPITAGEIGYAYRLACREARRAAQ